MISLVMAITARCKAAQVTRLTCLLQPTTLRLFRSTIHSPTRTLTPEQLSKVDFYQGTTLLGTDTTSPYTIAWTNVPVGVYSLTAKATDDNGAVTVSSAVTVNVFNSSSVNSLSLNGTSGYVSVPNSSTINI